MKNLQVGHFVWRPAGERDRKLIEGWIELDPDHAAKGVTADFFCVSGSLHECYAVEDAHGLVIFYLRLSSLDTMKTLRLHIQFRPHERFFRRHWTLDALMEGFDWLKTAGSGSGVERMVCRATRPDLVLFLERRLGFQRDGEEFSYPIPPTHMSAQQGNALQ